MVQRMTDAKGPDKKITQVTVHKLNPTLGVYNGHSLTSSEHQEIQSILHRKLHPVTTVVYALDHSSTSAIAGPQEAASCDNSSICPGPF